MISAVSGVQTQPVSKTATTPPMQQKLGFLQYKDVFFSNQSYRAQLSNFLAHVNEHPLVLSYAHQDSESIWQKIVPSQRRDVVLLTPLKPDLEAARSTAAQPAEELADDPDNLLGTSSFIIHNEVEPPPEAPTTVKLESFTGEKLVPNLAFQLGELYHHMKLPRETVSWVQQQNHQMGIIGTQHPFQAGFQKQEHPVLGMLIHGLAKILAPLLGLQVDNHTVKFPNGREMDLQPTSWKGPDGQPTRIYQVRGLPDGSWLRLKSPINEELMPLDNPKNIRQRVAQKIDPLEKSGKVRELPPTSHYLPAITPTPEVNPFAQPAAISPTGSETFLY